MSMASSPARFDSSRPDGWRFREGEDRPRHTAPRSSDWVSEYTDGLVARVAEVCDRFKPTPLAARLNLHPETVRRYLNGQRPSPEFLAALCRELGVSPQWLLLGEGQMHRIG